MSSAYSFSILNKYKQTRYFSYTCRESIYYDYNDYYNNNDLLKINLRTPGKSYSKVQLDNLCNFLETNILKSNKVYPIDPQTICIDMEDSNMFPEPPSISLVIFIMRYMTKYFSTECTFDFILSELITKRWYRFQGIPRSRFKTALYMYLCYISDITLGDTGKDINDACGPATYLDNINISSAILNDFINRYPKECEANIRTIQRSDAYPFCFLHDRILKFIYNTLHPEIDLDKLAQQHRSSYW